MTIAPDPSSGAKERPAIRARIVRRDGSPSIERVGSTAQSGRDLYHLMLAAPWWLYVAALAGLFLGFNALFAALYAARPGSIANAAPGSLSDAFFFSVETLATVGYGAMSPASTYGHVVATIEIIVGMLGVALTTGLTFAKFTRPTSRVLFSKTAVIAVFDGVPTLMFRAANLRSNQILEARVRLTLVHPEETPEGYAIRRFVDLDLVRETSPIFALTWTVMHRIDRSSPLRSVLNGPHGWHDIELIAVITGIDETFSSTIHSRQSYLWEDVAFDRVFADVIQHGADGIIRIDYRLFDNTRAAAVTLSGTASPHTASPTEVLTHESA